jgi:predicted anti-sigma-YlaC factor YlaD
MSCKRFREMVYSYKELGGKDRALVEDHMKTCSSCAEELRRINSSFEMLHSLKANFENALPTPDVTSEVMRSVRRSKELHGSILEKISIPRFALLRYTLAGLSLCFVILFVVENNRTELARQPSTAYQNSQEKVSLNTGNLVATFKKELRSRTSDKDRTSSFFACIEACRLDDNSSDCSTCLQNHSKSYRDEKF